MKNAAKDWRFRRLWSKQEFLKSYGSLKLPISTIPYNAVFGMSGDEDTLEHFVNKMSQFNHSVDSIEEEKKFLLNDIFYQFGPAITQAKPEVNNNNNNNPIDFR